MTYSTVPGQFLIGRSGGGEHAVPVALFAGDLRAAKNSDESAAAYTQRGVCGEPGVLDAFVDPWRPWRPGEKACGACAKALTP